MFVREAFADEHLHFFQDCFQTATSCVLSSSKLISVFSLRTQLLGKVTITKVNLNFNVKVIQSLLFRVWSLFLFD